MDKLMAILALTCFGLFGTAVLLYGVYDAKGKWEFLQGAKEAEGLVKYVGQKTVVTGSGSSRSSSNIDYAEVEYATAEGKTIVFEQQFGLIEGCPEKGAKVKVAYHDKDPQQAMISSFASLWAGDILVTVMGLIFATIGLIAYKLLSSG